MSGGVFQMIEHGSGRECLRRPIINRHHGYQESRRIGARHDTQHPKILKHGIATISQGLIEGLGNLAAKLTGLAVIRPILEARSPALPAPRPAPQGKLQSMSIVFGALSERSATILFRCLEPSHDCSHVYGLKKWLSNLEAYPMAQSAPDAGRSGEPGRSIRDESLIRRRRVVFEETGAPHIRRGAGVFTENRARDSGSTIQSFE
jgi:hypothetical protein